MKGTIIISEVAHTGEVHFQVNSCFAQMISEIYSNHRVIFIAEEKHLIAVKKNLQNSKFFNLEFSPYKGFYDEKNFRWKSRIIGECIQILKILRQGKKLNNKVYIWTCLFPTGHFFLNFVTLFQKKAKHVVILHGELEFLKIKGKRKFEVLLGFILKTAIYLSSNRTKYIVLGDNIKQNLNDLISNRILRRTYSILHPYNFFVDEKNLSNLSINKILKIGAIGTQMLSKNSNYIYSLAQHFRKDIIDNKINFITIGKVLPELYPLESELVNKQYSNSFVSQRDFEFEISKLDFIIFFYDNSAYKLCASGAIFEAIRLEIPIISIKNDFFQSIFETFGDMGFLCDNLDDIKIVINELKNGGHKENLKIFKNNMIEFKMKNELKNISTKLKSIL